MSNVAQKTARMSVADILKDLELYTGRFPKRALQEAVAQREAITPELLRVVEEVAADPAAFAKREDHMLLLFAIFLLAQFREKQAYEPLVKVVSAPGDVPDALLGDTLTEGLNRILASVFNGDPTPLQSLIEDPGVDDYVRWAAIDAFPVLVEAGEMTREAVVAYFERLFTGGLERKPDVVWDGLVGAVADLRAPELLDHARRAYSENLADRSIADLQSTEHEVLHGTSRRSRHGTLITDTIAELQGWACFDERRLRRAGEARGASEAEAGLLGHIGRQAGQGRPKRPVPMRQRQEVQEVLRQQLILPAKPRGGIRGPGSGPRSR